MLNKSQTRSYFTLESFRFAISGATYPGVPHFENRYSFNSVDVANPKSTIFKLVRLSTSLKIRFSGLISR